MKIMHLLNSNKYSGAENVVCQIMEMFRNDEDMEMIYVSPYGPIEQSLKNRNILYHGLNNFTVNDIRGAIAEINPDVIHAHDVTASVMASVSAPKNIKLISHMHVNNSNMSKINMKSIIYRVFSKRFYHIFWVSNSSYENYIFKKALEKKSSVLVNVIDKEPILKKAIEADIQTAYDIVFIGRMQFQKNPDKLLNVLKILKEKYNENFSAAIIGNGQLYKDVNNKIQKLELDRNVKMLGYVENPMGMLQKAKVMILTSRFEGTPMCALEAMALGTVIVSTPTDGMIDLIKPGKNGYLYSEDEDLAKAINLIISNNVCREKMSITTKEIFDSLTDLQAYRENLSNIYER